MRRRAIVRYLARGAVLCSLAIGLSDASVALAQQGGNGFLFQEPAISFNFRFGYDHASAGSDLYRFITSQHTIDQSDFSALSFAGDVAFRLSSRLDLALGGGYSKSTMPSEFRDFVDNNDQPIEQTTTFSRTPLNASLKWYPMPRGAMIGSIAWVPARFAPFVGLGGGIIKYRLEQRGDFINFATMVVFPDHFKSGSTVPSAHIYGGMDWSLGPHVAVTGEARYTWARAELGADYIGFEQLDLSGVSFTGGLSFRF